MVEPGGGTWRCRGCGDKNHIDIKMCLRCSMVYSYSKLEKSAADKLADHLELAIAGLHGANVDVKFLENRLKDYRGEK